MKITIRLIVSLIFVAVLVAAIFSYLQVLNEKETQLEDLKRRGQLLAESLQESIKDLLPLNDKTKLNQLVEKFGNRERLFGVIVYNNQGGVISASTGLLSKVLNKIPQVNILISENRSIDFVDIFEDVSLHVFLFPIAENDRVIGIIGLFHNTAYIEQRLEEIWRDNFLRLLTLSLLIIVTTVIVVRWSIVGPIVNFVEWMKNIRMGKGIKQMEAPKSDLFGPLAQEVSYLTKSLSIARAKAEEEARLRISGEAIWTAERLKEHVRSELGSRNLFLVSNREPYMHIRKGRKRECIIPAGGLVTALDPMLRACGGVWIAHGAGDADFEVVDKKGKLRVPPDEPSYTLKRVWLSKEEEQGYYYGFSNEGIWPLCHITHTRPDFRLEDWMHYQKVNEKFTESILEEIKDEAEPLVLIQDYHFALVPFLIKSKRPDARVAIFWHIPWPNPEAFSICPWQKEILTGLLGADLIGFHIQFHCNNFLETIDRVLESKINWEQFSVERAGQVTYVKPFPISVAFPALIPDEFVDDETKRKKKENLLTDLGMEAEFVGIGVDRIDYTKGIIERFKAIERFFDKYPEFVGRFIFVELGAPSRTHIPRYQDLLAEVETTIENICWKYQTKKWKPIVFLKAHHSREEINKFYKIANVCLVTSLHDGMNLVAKEFIASRSDEDGVLILSQFTGASRELHDAFIVNPYDIEEVADAIHAALNMNREEKKERMNRLRDIIAKRNIYRWAGNLVSTLNSIRISKPVEKEI